MKAGKHGQARQRLGSEPVITLGNEPPLFVAGTNESDTGRTAISLRWLLGTVLTGVTSIFLMGGALVVALDGRTSAAVTSDADLVAQAQTGQVAGDQGQGDEASRAQKGDRLLAPVKPVTNKEVIQVSTVTRQGDRDLIRTKPYIKFTATLETRTDIDASDIPPFDPLKIFSDQDLFPDHGAAESIYGAAVDGEVTISVHDFPVASPGLDADLSFSSDEVEELVREDGRFQTDKASAFAGAQAPDTTNRFASFSMLMATPQTQTASLDGNVKIVPENVSEVAKTGANLNKSGTPDTATKTPPKPPADIVVTAAKGDTLKKLLMANSADEDEADEIVTAFRKSESSVTRISAGNKLRIGLGPDPERPGEFRPERVSVYDATSHLGTVALNDDGDYVAAEEPLDDFVDEGSSDGGSDEVAADSQTPTIYNSLYQTALKQGLPDTMVNELVHIFSFGVDFNAHVRPGDKIELFYADEEDGAASNGPPEVLFASLTIGGVEKRFYRFHSNRSGSTDFFDGTGKSAQQFLMRKPITGGIFRSGFGARRHPILGYVRMHPGVDWAAPRGTPVYASGNGVVAEAGWKSGYGRWVMISHGNGYDTGYGHMSGIASGIAPGTKVRQGQVIGYVGSTGLSTGPHLHYEVHINESPVDPLRIRLPSGRELRGTELVAFQKERKRIDDLIGVEEDASSATVARN